MLSTLLRRPLASLLLSRSQATGGALAAQLAALRRGMADEAQPPRGSADSEPASGRRRPPFGPGARPVRPPRSAPAGDAAAATDAPRTRGGEDHGERRVFRPRREPGQGQGQGQPGQTHHQPGQRRFPRRSPDQAEEATHGYSQPRHYIDPGEMLASLVGKTYSFDTFDQIKNDLANIPKRSVRDFVDALNAECNAGNIDHGVASRVMVISLRRLAGATGVRPIDEAHKLVARLKEMNVPLSSASATALLMIYAAQITSGNLVEETYNNYVRQGVLKPNEEALSTLVNYFGKRGMLDRALQYYRDMTEKHGIKPSLTSYNALMSAHAQSGNLAEVQKLFDSLPTLGFKPNNTTYGTLVLAAVRAEQLDMAMSILQDMRNKNLEVPTVVYNTILAYYCSKQQQDKAWQWLEQVEGQGAVLNIVSYNTLLSMLVKLQDEDSITKMMARMSDKSIRPDRTTIDILMSYYADNNKVHMVEGWVEQLPDRRKKPTLSTALKVIRAYARANDETQVETWYDSFSASRKREVAEAVAETYTAAGQTKLAAKWTAKASAAAAEWDVLQRAQAQRQGGQKGPQRRKGVEEEQH